MVFLLLSPRPQRELLVSFLEAERLAVTVCETASYLRAVAQEGWPLNIAIIDASSSVGDLASVAKDLCRDGWTTAVLIVGAPFRTELAYYRAGATSVHGPVYSPHSVALQCKNILGSVRAHINRKTSPSRAHLGDYVFGDCIVSPRRGTLIGIGNRTAEPLEVRLSPLQLSLLHTLRGGSGSVLSYEYLCNCVWNRHYDGRTNVIRESVSELRKKFRHVGADLSKFLWAIYGSGLRYDPDGCNIHPNSRKH